MKSREKYVAPSSNFYNYTAGLNAKDGMVYLLSVGDFVYEPGYYLQRNSFDSFLIEVILEGSMTIEYDGKATVLRHGSVVLLDCYKPHCYHTNERCRVLWLHFDGAPARAYYSAITRINGGICSTSNVSMIVNRINAIYELFLKQLEVDDVYIALILTSLLTLAANKVDRHEQINRDASSIGNVIRYISEHIDEELTVERLSSIAAFSKYHFIRLFRSTVGMTPHQYIITARMDYAKYLLKTMTVSIQDVASMVGYTSESMFYTTFRKHIGITPAEYREKDVE